MADFELVPASEVRLLARKANPSKKTTATAILQLGLQGVSQETLADDQRGGGHAQDEGFYAATSVRLLRWSQLRESVSLASREWMGTDILGCRSRVVPVSSR
jgi:hypothetical protein